MPLNATSASRSSSRARKEGSPWECSAWLGSAVCPPWGAQLWEAGAGNCLFRTVAERGREALGQDQGSSSSSLAL